MYNNTLETDPRIHYPLLVAEIQTDAANMLQGHIEGGVGATSLTRSDQDWLQYCQGVNKPRYELAAPTRYNCTASQATIKLYDLDHIKYMVIIQALSDIKRKIFQAVGETIRIEMEDPSGTITKTTQEIMEFLYEHYGTPTEADLSIIHAQIAEPFPSDTLVYSGVIRQQKLFGQLAVLDVRNSSG